jgi:hypothetical protein
MATGTAALLFSGGAAVLGRGLFRLVFHALSAVMGKQSFKIVTIRAIATKSVFIE